MSMEKIKKLKNAGFFSSLDVQMAGLVSRMQPAADENLLLAAALASRAINQGHACVDLAQYAGRSWPEILEASLPMNQDDAETEEDELQDLDNAQGACGTLPALEAWQNSLNPPVVGGGCETKEARTLLVLAGSRLYLRRYWDYERKVEKALEGLNKASGIAADEKTLDRYFGRNSEQKNAAQKAIARRLSILSGGPGTGKTFTLARAVALLAEMNAKGGKRFDVRMVAPTGKAAVRMVESLREARAKLQRDGIDAAILTAVPEQASTIHRLLVAQYRSPYFQQDANNLLAADMVIVDEASMVDLPLMAKLLDALPATCSLMLVGDIDQLASVEPGRVYGDVCHAARDGGPLAGCLARLVESRRFPETSVIGRISKLINAGDEQAWHEMQASKDSKNLEVLPSTTLHEENGAFRKLVEEKMKDFLKAKDPTAVLQAADNFRILCALRKGPYGANRMNRRVEKILAEKGLEPGGRFYDHQLIMITVNTPSLDLYNGDVGVVLAREGAGKKREYLAWFYDENKAARSLPVNLLPDHETAFAMTVHKSQGSEFPHVALILPDDGQSPILTRELLYTGMTRVRIDQEQQTGKLVMWCTEASFKKAVRTKTARTTGLFAT